MSFQILGTGSARPACSQTNDDLSAFLDTSDEWISTRTGKPKGHRLSASRQEMCIRDRAGNVYIVLRKGQRHSRSHADLPFDQVDAADHLRHRMLHLQAGIHLHKIEILIRVQQEFDGPNAGIANRLGGLHRRLRHLLAELRRDRRGGAFLDHLLVLPLDGTFALPQRDDIPLPVAEELHLNMFRGGDKLLQINAAVPKSKLGLDVYKRQRMARRNIAEAAIVDSCSRLPLKGRRIQ